jgi:type 1 glutamine amidotransferase
LATLDERTYSGGTMPGDHPILWSHTYEGGRAWYTAGGHTAESFSEALFLDHLGKGILWSSGMIAP